MTDMGHKLYFITLYLHCHFFMLVLILSFMRHNETHDSYETQVIYFVLILSFMTQYLYCDTSYILSHYDIYSISMVCIKLQCESSYDEAVPYP